MAQLLPGSVIKKADGNKEIATVDQLGVLEARVSDPPSPVVGRIWMRTDTNTIKIMFPTGIRTINTI